MSLSYRYEIKSEKNKREWLESVKLELDKISLK